MAATRFVVPWVLILLLASACSHSEPFQDPDESNQGPFAPGDPVKLTYNLLIDATPAWLPGDTLLTYSFEQRHDEFNNNDLCLGALPATGGTRSSQSCPNTAAALDSVERYQSAVALNDSIVALVQAFRRPFDRLDQESWLGTAPWRQAQNLTPRKRFPQVSTGGFIESSADYLSPVGGDELAYLSMVDDAVCLGSSYPCDTTVLVRYGRMVSQLSLADNAEPTVLSGTAYATSAAPGRNAGAVLFTLPFDPRVYERSASGSVSVVFDFGADSGSARDAMIVGGQLVAVIGGQVQPATTSSGAQLQLDDGGTIALVSLGSAQVRYLWRRDLLFRRPVLSSNGRIVVAVSQDSDLYRFDVP